MAKEKKSSGIAVVLSFLVPGLGQIYCGKIGLGIMFILFAVIFAALSIFLIGVPLYLILWVYSMYDAYQTAESSGKRKSRKKTKK